MPLFCVGAEECVWLILADFHDVITVCLLINTILIRKRWKSISVVWFWCRLLRPSFRSTKHIGSRLVMIFYHHSWFPLVSWLCPYMFTLMQLSLVVALWFFLLLLFCAHLVPFLEFQHRCRQFPISICASYRLTSSNWAFLYFRRARYGSPTLISIFFVSFVCLYSSLCFSIRLGISLTWSELPTFFKAPELVISLDLEKCKSYWIQHYNALTEKNASKG